MGNRASGKVTYTPEFYLFQHFSYFVPAGSVKLESDGNYDNALAFITPDDTVVLVLANTQHFAQTVSVKVSLRNLSAKLPPKSFDTFFLAASSVASTNTK